MMPYPTLGLHTPRGVCVLCVSSKGGLHRVHGAPDVASKEKKIKEPYPCIIASDCT